MLGHHTLEAKYKGKFMTKLNCDMGESFGIYRAGNDEEIMPLIDEETKEIMIQKKRFSLISNNKNHFFYPADGAGHKNHLRLLEAFLLINENYKLYLTLSENDFSKLSEKFPSLKTKSSKIINLGQMPRKKILKLSNQKTALLTWS